MQSVYSAAPTDWALVGSGLTPLQRCSRCILQPQPTGPSLEVVLLLCRDAVGVFCSPNRLGPRWKWSYSFAEMQSVYSTAPTDWALVGSGLTPLQRCSRCILQPQPAGAKTQEKKHPQNINKHLQKDFFTSDLSSITLHKHSFF